MTTDKKKMRRLRLLLLWCWEKLSLQLVETLMDAAFRSSILQ
jgi:hypothetical protein